MKKKFRVLLAVVTLVLSLGLIPAASVMASPGSGIEGLWHLDGNANDSSGNANHGTLNLGAGGNTDPTAAWVSGKFDKAVDLDGVDDYVSVADADSLDLTDDFTIEAWIYMDVKDVTQQIISKHDTGSKTGYAFFVHSDNKLYFQFGDGAGSWPYASTSSDTALDTSQWYHVAVTRSGDDVVFYLNGGSDGGTSSMGTNDAAINTVNLWIGNNVDSGTGSYDFEGLIDEVRIWDEVLDSTEIAESYALGTAQPDATVVELGEKIFNDDVIIFTSAFHGLDATSCSAKDSIAIYIMSNYGETIDDVSARNKVYTPKGTTGCWSHTGGTGGTSTTVGVAHTGTNPCKTIHLFLDLDIKKRVGFNVQFLR
jgi:hypothetical protein